MYRGKRALDLVLSLSALVALAPLLIAVALAVWLTDGYPIFYRACRVGRNGRLFVMLKFRTMRNCPSDRGSTVTAAQDPRVFRFGAFLRRTKIDELPQLVNIVRGQMSVIGPRPEDPRIVARYYDARAREVLRALPGLSSPGSLYDYTHGPALLDGALNVEMRYVACVLPEMLALDWVYVRRISLVYDLSLILRTLSTLIQVIFGRHRFPDPPELAEARPVADGWRSVWSARLECDVRKSPQQATGV